METTETRETGFLAQPLLTVAEAAKLAHVSRTHMWRLVRRGEIEALRVGSTESAPIRIPTERFLCWLYDTQTPEDLPPVTRADLEPWLAEESA